MTVSSRKLKKRQQSLIATTKQKVIISKKVYVVPLELEAKEETIAKILICLVLFQ